MALRFLTRPSAALHLQDSPDWYTPSPYVEAARQVMGGIDLDPASSYHANLTVKATTYYTKTENGLLQEWKGTVFLNPPGGQVPAFWKKLVESYHLPFGGIDHQSTTQFIWIGYSLEQLQTLQGVCLFNPLNYSMCVPRRRIAFVENEAKRALRLEALQKAGKKLTEKQSPTHANYILYGGPNRAQFVDVFTQFGQSLV